MPISVDGTTSVISVPKSYMLQTQAPPNEIRQLDTEQFRKDLRNWEDDEDGRIFSRTSRYTAPVDIGGVQLASVVFIEDPYTVTFEDGQYAVVLSGSNNNIADETNVNQVSIRPTNSAGLTYSKQVEDSAFLDGRIWVDSDTGVDSAQYPAGTYSLPCKTLENAQEIISDRGLSKRLHLKGSFTILATDDISDYNILGESIVLTSLNVLTGANTNGLVIQDAALTGDLNGNVTARRATSFTNLQDFDGELQGTGLGGTITLQLGTSPHKMIDCYSEEAGVNLPILDCQDIVDPEINIRRYSGGLQIRNFSSGEMTIGMTQGHIILHSSCTGGLVNLQGIYRLTDNSGGTTVVHGEGTSLTDVKKLLRADQVHTPTAIVHKEEGTENVIMTKNVSGSKLGAADQIEITQP